MRAIDEPHHAGAAGSARFVTQKANREAGQDARVALLRAINVGGRKAVLMSDLRELLTGLGFAEVRTLLQTGNLVFRGGAPFDVELEHLLEARALERLDLRTDFLVRSATQWGRIVSGNPC
ncbi:MAG: DUF1697 domain-containing protein [Vulcanimicrobiaceae bacterium]